MDKSKLCDTNAYSTSTLTQMGPKYIHAKTQANVITLELQNLSIYDLKNFYNVISIWWHWKGVQLVEYLSYTKLKYIE